MHIGYFTGLSVQKNKGKSLQPSITTPPPKGKSFIGGGQSIHPFTVAFFAIFSWLVGRQQPFRAGPLFGNVLPSELRVPQVDLFAPVLLDLSTVRIVEASSLTPPWLFAKSPILAELRNDRFYRAFHISFSIHVTSGVR